MRTTIGCSAAGCVAAGAVAAAPAASPAEPSPDTSIQAVDLEEAYQVARDRLVGEFELRYLSALVRRARGNISRASRLAGIDRATLYRLMEKHGLQRDSLPFGPE